MFNDYVKFRFLLLKIKWIVFYFLMKQHHMFMESWISVNCQVWCSDNQHELLKFVCNCPKVNVWCAIMRNKIFGYSIILKYLVLLQIKNIKSQISNRMDPLRRLYNQRSSHRKDKIRHRWIRDLEKDIVYQEKISNLTCGKE